MEYSLVSFIEQQTKTILIGAYFGMIFSIYMLIKYMLSLELNSKPEFKGLTTGKVKGFENSSHIGIILKDSSESYDFCSEISS